jgi:formate dehydrogenase accessory protein FdhE
MAAASSREPYEARLRRADKLASSLPFAAEILKFYRQIAALQQSIYAQLAGAQESAASASKSAGGAAKSDLSSSLASREEPDLTQILPQYRGFLSVVEKNGPKNLGLAAREMAALPSDSWVALLGAYWQTAGRFDQQIGAFAQFFARAALQPGAEFAAAGITAPPQIGTQKTCPLCGGRPLLGVLRVEGDGGKRFLMCSFCLQEWEFRRILCPTCGEVAEAKLPVYVAEQLPHMRVEACETCKFYLPTTDLTKDGHAVPLVDDLAAIPLTLWAHEQGYTRLQPNLLGT